MENKFYELFKVKKPIIGMIHLAGTTRDERIQRALEELTLYEKEGVNGAIIEDYCGPAEDIYKTLEETQKNKFKIILGVNNLRNPYASFYAKDLGAKFVQFDSVQSNHLNVNFYNQFREKYPDILIFGGVRFKYKNNSHNSLEKDLDDGMKRCDAIITTGDGTGIETPVEKLKQFKNYMGEFPLIVDAGLNDANCGKQMQIADGAIVGSYFKPYGNVRLPVDREKVKDLMKIVKQIRKNSL